MPEVSKFTSIRASILEADRLLPFDIYVMVSGGKKFVLLRGEGDSLTKERLQQLSDKTVFVPKSQEDKLEDYLKSQLNNPVLDSPKKAVVLKESAFYHLHTIFMRGDVGKAITDSIGTVQNMMEYIVKDVNSIRNLIMLSSHDYYTYNHSVDVSIYCMALAKKMFADDKQRIFNIGIGGLLHDIGKSRISPAIINKPSKLDEKEWAEMKKHPEYGVDILKNHEAGFSEDALSVVMQHHENHDGSGYPHGLKGREIHIFAKLAAIADVFDALTTNRSYSKAMNPMEALKLMTEYHSKKFDPAIFSTFKSTIGAEKIET